MLFCSISNGQSYSQKLCDIFSSSGPLVIQSGSLSNDTSYNPSGSTWEIDWSETHVYDQVIKYDNSSPSRSYELRLGKGGQIYSYKNSGFGEALPPQWRPSFDNLGGNISDPGPSIPIASNHGNWAPWNDEVWQFVGSDQRDFLGGKVKTRNIHQAGSYMNNYSHRASDHINTPFYSPKVKEFSDINNGSFTGVYWIQSEDPSYVYDPWNDCDVCASDPFKPSIILYNKLTNLGDGVIQVDYLIYNYHRTRGIDYWNVPFMGIRNSSLPYAFVSNSTTDPTSFAILNTKPGHPVVGDEAIYLPEFKDGAVIKTSGTSSASSGWFAFSTQADGNGPSLGLVTAKSTSNPTNGYGDFRYGTAMSNATRDVTILTRRAIGGAADSNTGLKPWGIVAGESIQGRYFLVTDSNINSMVQQIQTRNLSSFASIEKMQIDSIQANNIHYDFTPSPNGTYQVLETNSSSAYITLNSLPFKGSYPVFLMSIDSESILSSDPYHYSKKPYDGIVKKIELLGFSSTPKNKKILITNLMEKNRLKDVSIYPNPTTGLVTIDGIEAELDNFRILNYLGQDISYLVKTELVNNDKLILDLSRLEKGIYIIKTETTFNKLYKQ